MCPCSFNEKKRRPIAFLDYTVRRGPLLSSRKTTFFGKSCPADWPSCLTVDKSPFHQQPGDIFAVLGRRRPMRTFFLFLVTLLCTSVAFGQYGRAPDGYYPSAYTGD